MSIISTQSLCKSFGTHQVLKDVDLCVDQGKLVGFLGPNGAGKTTTIRILLGLLMADTGSATLFGRSVTRQGKQVRRRIGYLPGDVYFYPGMTGRATLRFMARVRGQHCQPEIDRLANALELELDRTVRNYSTGMRQKLGLIQALMHRPDLLILDEPTSALDPLIRKQVFTELKRVTGEGRTVLFSSHSLDEVEQLCDEVIILRAGRIVEHQQIEMLKQKAVKRVHIEFAAAQPIPEQLPDGLNLIERNGKTIHAAWKGDLNPLVDWLGQFQLHDLIVERPDLNDLFITYYATDGGRGEAIGHG